MEQAKLTKEEFKKLRAEAGFESDSEFMRKMGYHSYNVANRWFNDINTFPQYLRNAFFLFKLNLNFDMKEYENFILKLKKDTREKDKSKIPALKKEDRDLVKRAKIALNNLSYDDYDELEKKNIELKKEYEFLNNLLLEKKSKKK